MKKLFKNKKGFTLMEMLIVVAIIVILVAISVPVFTSKLDDAKIATDQANERAAKAVAIAKYLSGDTDFTADKEYYYNVTTGDIEDPSTTIKPYGKYDGSKYPGTTSSVEHSKQVISVEVESDGDVVIGWETPSTATP